MAMPFMVVLKIIIEIIVSGGVCLILAHIS